MIKIAIGALLSMLLAGAAHAQTTNPTPPPVDPGVTEPGPAMPQSGAYSGSGGVTPGDMIEQGHRSDAATGASTGDSIQSNAPGETGTLEQDNPGVPAPTGTQGQD